MKKSISIMERMKRPRYIGGLEVTHERGREPFILLWLRIVSNLEFWILATLREHKKL